MKTARRTRLAGTQDAELLWNHNGSIMVPKLRGATMPVNITLKNIPDALYLRLKQSAEANRRSLNMEAIQLVEQALALATGHTPVSERLKRIRELHHTLPPPKISHKEIDGFKKEGRK